VRDFIVCAALIVGLSAGGSAQNLEQEARRFAQSVDAAVTQRDTASLEGMIGDGFEFVHSTGRVEDRASYIRRAAGGQLASQGNAGEILEDRLSIHHAVAIRTTLTSVKLPTDASGTATQIYTRYVYEKAGARWRWISAQSTVVVKPVKPVG